MNKQAAKEARQLADRVEALLPELQPALPRSEINAVKQWLKGLKVTLEHAIARPSAKTNEQIQIGVDELHDSLASAMLVANGAEQAFLKARYGSDFVQYMLRHIPRIGQWNSKCDEARAAGLLGGQKSFESKIHAKYLPYLREHRGEELHEENDGEASMQSGKKRSIAPSEEASNCDASSHDRNVRKKQWASDMIVKEEGDQNRSVSGVTLRDALPRLAKVVTAAANKCPKGHALRSRAAQHHVCDVCGREDIMEGVVYGCERCNWDICQACSKKAQVKEGSTLEDIKVPIESPPSKVPRKEKPTDQAQRKERAKPAKMAVPEEVKEESTLEDVKVPVESPAWKAPKKGRPTDAERKERAKPAEASASSAGAVFELQICTRVESNEKGGFTLFGSCRQCERGWTKRGDTRQPFNGHARILDEMASHARSCGGGEWQWKRDRSGNCPEYVWTLAETKVVEEEEEEEVEQSPSCKSEGRSRNKASGKIEVSEEVQFECTDKLGPMARLRSAQDCASIPKDMLPAGTVRLSNLRKQLTLRAPAKAPAAEVGELPPGVGVVPQGLPQSFNSLLIVGPSGSGKSTLLAAVLAERFPEFTGSLYPDGEWLCGRPIIEGFPEPREGVKHLCALGLSSVPTWCKPFSVLSKGEQYRANAARKLATRGVGEPAVFDEWTSELDRALARAASMAIARSLVRQRKLDDKSGPVFFATCHDDIQPFLGCDVVIRCEIGKAPELVHCSAATVAEHRHCKSSESNTEGNLPHICAMPTGSMCLKQRAEEQPAAHSMCGRWLFSDEGYHSAFDISLKTSKTDGDQHFQMRIVFVGTADLHPLTDCEGRCWHVTSFESLQLRVRPAAEAGKLAVQRRTSNQEEWVSGYAQELARFDGGHVDDVLKVKYFKEAGSYSQEALAILQENGWHVPKERRKDLSIDVLDYEKTQDQLYPGLVRFSEDWLGNLDSKGRGFHYNPKFERREEGLTHLVAYVGETDGSLSPALGIASCYMDCEFDGLCVHVVPKLPARVVKDFRVAAILGPSGSGTSSLARECFGHPPNLQWSEKASVRAHLPDGDVGDEVLDVVGLDAQMTCRPYATLSGGEQFRARVARLLAHPRSSEEFLVLEDFTSVLDRHAAQAFASNMQRYIVRNCLRKVVVVSCLCDYIGLRMLEPDWTFEVHSGRLTVFDPDLSKLDDRLQALQRSHDEELLQIRKKVEEECQAKYKSRRQQADAVKNHIGSVEGVLRRVFQSPAFSLSERFQASMLEHLKEQSLHELAPHQGVQEEYEEELAQMVRERSARLEVQHRSTMEAIKQFHKGRQSASSCIQALASDASPPLYTSPTTRLQLEVRRASQCEWMFFRKHHYKCGSLHTAAVCLVASLFGEPVAFTSMINNGVNIVANGICSPTKKNVGDSSSENSWKEWVEANYPKNMIEWEMFREHRTVVLPPFQGIGIGSLLADCVAYLCQLMNLAFVSMTVHPLYGGYRDASPFWRSLPTNQDERSALRGNLKFSHIWVGASRPDGSTDESVQARLEERIDLNSLSDLSLFLRESEVLQCQSETSCLTAAGNNDDDSMANAVDAVAAGEELQGSAASDSEDRTSHAGDAVADGEELIGLSSTGDIDDDPLTNEGDAVAEVMQDTVEHTRDVLQKLAEIISDDDPMTNEGDAVAEGSESANPQIAETGDTNMQIDAEGAAVQGQHSTSPPSHLPKARATVTNHSTSEDVMMEVDQHSILGA